MLSGVGWAGWTVGSLTWVKTSFLLQQSYAGYGLLRDRLCIAAGNTKELNSVNMPLVTTLDAKSTVEQPLGNIIDETDVTLIVNTFGLNFSFYLMQLVRLHKCFFWIRRLYTKTLSGTRKMFVYAVTDGTPLGILASIITTITIIMKRICRTEIITILGAVQAVRHVQYLLLLGHSVLVLEVPTHMRAVVLLCSRGLEGEPKMAN
ncbi:hypothetical protein DFH05DRAFT_1458907 [Lentinula detonsa]|uniref:Uncharacterized protein n=1 Tax=Lentinula detonsa TaxID=2804962 RepID=A0A9W8P4I7_9AGAR|nr:hypothetical protein DFH05DRAFT_1458907 [Lentinula detonsa]